MKKMCALIVCMTVCGAALFAQAPATDFDTKAEGNGVVITKYKGKGGDVVIPASIGGKAVVGIGKQAFSDCSSLTSVTIPDSVTAIGGSAFYRCSGLKTISVHSANQWYKAIDGVLFTKDGKTLHTYPAGGKTAYRIPDSVTAIGEWAFHGRSSLTSVTIPASVTIIGEDAFSGCASLTSVTIPEGVTTIDDWAFSGCTSLTQITIPDSVTMLGRGAFVECGIASITLPTGITFINRGLFARCSSLESITIPENITSIGPVAFARCSSLKSVTLPENISASYGVFSECVSLDESVRANLQERFGDGVFDSGGEGP